MSKFFTESAADYRSIVCVILKEGSVGPCRQSYFWYDNDKDLKDVFFCDTQLMMLGNLYSNLYAFHYSVLKLPNNKTKLISGWGYCLLKHKTLNVHFTSRHTMGHYGPFNEFNVASKMNFLTIFADPPHPFSNQLAALPQSLDI